MAWHNLIITKPSKLFVKNAQLLCDQADNSISLDMEDIASIVLDSAQINLTAALISQLAEHNIALITCNERHLPNGLLTSLNPHSKRLPLLHLQIDATRPFQKQLWKRVIQQKITNQAAILDFFQAKGSKNLYKISESVQSGDSTNREAVAAKKYFSYLFDDFIRRSDSKINSALNYGYAVLRANVARQLLAFGFTAELGIHHKNPQNRFNLADDMLEPLRPFLDAWVKLHMDEAGQPLLVEPSSNLCIQDKALLVSAQQMECSIEGDSHTLQSAIYLMAKSLVSVFQTNDVSKIILPEVSVPIKLKSLD